MKKRKERSKLAIITPVVLWTVLIFYLNIIVPYSLISFIIFYLLFTLALFYTSGLIFNFPRNLFLTITAIAYLLLRQFNIDNFINIMLLVAIFVTFEFYFRNS